MKYWTISFVICVPPCDLWHKTPAWVQVLSPSFGTEWHVSQQCVSLRCVCGCTFVWVAYTQIQKPNLKNMGVKLTNAFKHTSIDKAAFRRLVLCCKYIIKIIHVWMTFVIMRHKNVTIMFLRASGVTLETGRTDIKFTLYVLGVINITEFAGSFENFPQIVEQLRRKRLSVFVA